MRKFLDLARMDNRCAGKTLEKADDALAGQQSRQSETEKHLFRQSYIFLTTPKVCRLQYDAEGRGRCFYLIEKFGFDGSSFLLL